MDYGLGEGESLGTTKRTPDNDCVSAYHGADKEVLSLPSFRRPLQVSPVA